MAELINLKKRLIGKEDIDFDITGTNETENFPTPEGWQIKLSKLNASHFPLTRECRNKLNATNVDEALLQLSGKMDDFEPGTLLAEDTTVSFQPTDDANTIQNKINHQKKNLNGHTLTFLFPSSLAQNLYTTFIWQDFFNGTVVIAGGSSDNRIIIYDKQDINALFKIYRCQCEVRIEHFYFVHQKSLYAVSAESSSAVILKDCHFSGMEETESFAVAKIAGNAFFINCKFVNDLDTYPYVRHDYLPLSGHGRMTSTNAMSRDVADSFLGFHGGTSENNNGAQLYLCGAEHPSIPSSFQLIARNSEEISTLQGYKDGRLTWNRKDITLGYPNYSAAVSLGTKKSYTATDAGWLCITGDAGSSELWTAKINGAVVGASGGERHNTDVLFLPVNKGDEVTLYRGTWDENNTEEVYTALAMYFYPNK